MAGACGVSHYNVIICICIYIFSVIIFVLILYWAYQRTRQNNAYPAENSWQSLQQQTKTTDPSKHPKFRRQFFFFFQFFFLDLFFVSFYLASVSHPIGAHFAKAFRQTQTGVSTSASKVMINTTIN